MSWEQTGEFMSDGRPIWSCPDCGRRIWGHKVGAHDCTGTIPKKLKKEDLPCQKRGLAYKKVNDAGCGCSAVVFSCSLHELCTINSVKPEINDCVSCVDRVA